jgi:uncharacterized membrane protein HdeD (DUF308 family)
MENHAAASEFCVRSRPSFGSGLKIRYAKGQGMARLGNLKTLFLVEGTVMVLFGACALLLPPLAGVATVILVGWLLIASGLVGLVSTLRGRHAPGFWWALLSAIVTVAAGLMLFAWPLGGVISLSVALGLFLGVDGLLALGLALEHRRHMTPRWLWLLLNGVADIIIAGVIFAWLPSSAVWALGFFIGADMVISGFTLIALGTDVDKDSKDRLQIA